MSYISRHATGRTTRCSALGALWVLISGCSGGSAAPGVPDDPADVSPVLVGEQAPGFELPMASGEPYRLDPGALAKPVILVFYRGGWCPYCSAYLMQMRAAEELLVEMGYEILFVSADQVSQLADSLSRLERPYTLLSDNELEVAKRYGVAFKVDEATVQRYLEHGIDLEAASGRGHHMLPVPSLFLIGADGVIRFAYVNPNYKYRLDPELLLTAARVALTQQPLTPLRARESG